MTRFPGGTGVLKPLTLRLRFGAAIPLEDLKNLDSRAAADEATRRLWTEIERLEGELDAER